MTEVTVLVAVYNAEKYLRTCLDSLLCQTLRDIEIVCIDDCSTDSSLAILKEYANTDDRIITLHLNKNCGQAHARNEGLKLATGRYVAYLDSDDWLDRDALEKAVDVFNRFPKTGCVLLQLIKHFEGIEGKHDEPYPMPTFSVLSGSEAFALSLDWTVHGCYVGRRELYEQWPYDESCRAYSDDNTTRLHYLASSEVRQCSGRYFYRIYPHSVTHAVTVRRFDYLRANTSMKRQLIELNVSEKIIRRYENIRYLNLVDLYMFYHCHGHQLTALERQCGLKEMHLVWQSIDRSLLDKQLKRKFGYRPMSRWWMFRIEEWLYFTLRDLLGRNK